MLFIEFIALLGVIAGTGLGISALRSWQKTSGAEQEFQSDQTTKKFDDLTKALASRDYRQLEDWLVIYADRSTEKEREHVKTRRDELFIESNP